MTTTTRFGVASLLVSGAIIACAPVNDSSLRHIAAESPSPRAHTVAVVGAVYELDSGRVRFLD